MVMVVVGMLGQPKRTKENVGHNVRNIRMVNALRPSLYLVFHNYPNITSGHGNQARGPRTPGDAK